MNDRESLKELTMAIKEATVYMGLLLRRLNEDKPGYKHVSFEPPPMTDNFINWWLSNPYRNNVDRMELAKTAWNAAWNKGWDAAWKARI